MKRLPLILIVVMGMTLSCTRLQTDSPKKESTGEGSSASEGYKDDNKTTPATPAGGFENGTGTNTGDGKSNQPSTNTSTPGTDRPGQGPSNGQSNETVPPKTNPPTK